MGNSLIVSILHGLPTVALIFTSCVEIYFSNSVALFHKHFRKIKIISLPLKNKKNKNVLVILKNTCHILIIIINFNIHFTNKIYLRLFFHHKFTAYNFYTIIYTSYIYHFTLLWLIYSSCCASFNSK